MEYMFFPKIFMKNRGVQCRKDILFPVMLVERENAKTEAQYVLKT